MEKIENLIHFGGCYSIVRSLFQVNHRSYSSYVCAPNLVSPLLVIYLHHTSMRVNIPTKSVIDQAKCCNLEVEFEQSRGCLSNRPMNARNPAAGTELNALAAGFPMS